MHEEAVAAGKIVELGVNTPSSTQGVSSAASDVYKRQIYNDFSLLY